MPEKENNKGKSAINNNSVCALIHVPVLLHENCGDHANSWGQNGKVSVATIICFIFVELQTFVLQESASTCPCTVIGMDLRDGEGLTMICMKSQMGMEGQMGGWMEEQMG